MGEEGSQSDTEGRGWGREKQRVRIEPCEGYHHGYSMKEGQVTFSCPTEMQWFPRTQNALHSNLPRRKHKSLHQRINFESKRNV